MYLTLNQFEFLIQTLVMCKGAGLTLDDILDTFEAAYEDIRVDNDIDEILRNIESEL